VQYVSGFFTPIIRSSTIAVAAFGFIVGAPTVKPEAATAIVELLMMGVRTPETY
jgi:hypothetical protein